MLFASLLVGCGNNQQRKADEGQTESISVVDSVDKMTTNDTLPLTENPMSENTQTADEEISSPALSWNDIVVKLGKSYKVIGIYTMTQGGNDYTLIIYKKHGKYYINHCKDEYPPFDHEYSDLLVKKSSTTYVHNDPDSDMPEKYVISDGELNTYAYNPDFYEWVAMGTYWKVY